MGILITSANGTEGQVHLAGSRAVVAMFYKWSLQRRGESDDWTLRASLSFRKDSFLLSQNWPKKISLKSIDKWYEVIPKDGVAIQVTEDDRLIVEEATCRLLEQPPR